MSDEDRFSDLGGPSDGRSAAERLAELDETDPDRPEARPEPPRPSGRYTWVVGIVFLIAIAAASLNAIRTEGPGALGPDVGSTLPPFAAPLATAGIEKDANVKPDGDRSACTVELADVVNVCRLRDEHPVVVAFMFTRAADCEPQLDRIERVRASLPEVRFVGVIVREPVDSAERIVRRRGWNFPVVLDRDGAVSNVYGVSGCPTTVFAHRGGEVSATRIGQIDEATIRGEAEKLRR